MRALNQINKVFTSQRGVRVANELALYDQYGPVAYGVILHIIPEPELAQTVLVDLFASPQLKSRVEVPTIGEIIRLARANALAARPISGDSPSSPASIPAVNDTTDTPKVVFNLSFCQGYTFELIAEMLKLSSTNVLKALHTYFNYCRST